MATAEQIKTWLDSNQDKAGSQNFVTMTEEYNKLTMPTASNRGAFAVPPPAAAPTAAPDTGAYTDIGVPIGATAAPADTDPYSGMNTAKRIGVGAVTGIPDTAIAIGNAAVRANRSLPSWAQGLGMAGVADPQAQQEAPYVGPMLNKALGGQELPMDASTARMLLEGGASALAGGGLSSAVRAYQAAPSVVRAVLPTLLSLTRTTVAPTVGSTAGGAAGGAIADKLGLDPETGSLLGSILGGVGPGAAPGLYNRYTHNQFADQARNNAPAIAAAAERQGVQPTAGMLGNQSIQHQERLLSGSIGSRDYINNARQNAIGGVGAAMDRAAEARGATTAEPTPGTIGERLIGVTRESADALRARSEAEQLRLQDRVGAATPVEVAPVREQGFNMMTDPQAGLSVPGRAAIDYRITDQLAPLMNRDAAGQPIYQGNGETVPYGPFRGWRTDLGKSIDTPQGGRMPPASALYPGATEAMRVTAERQGVPRQDFENVQGRTRAVEGAGGDYEALQQFFDRQPEAAFNYLQRGEQNPARPGVVEATGHPEVNALFGDYMRLMGNQTINNPNQGARGPARLATDIETMHPDARSTIAGAQLPDIMDIATLARSIDYPPSQTGLVRSVGPLAENAVRTAVGSEALGQLGGATGIPGANTAGRLAGLGTVPLWRYLQARKLQGPTAINALGGGAAPQVMSMGDLVAALTAANSAQSQQGQ